MQRQLFNNDWSVTEKTANFGMNNGEAIRKVTLPFDAMAACPRTPDATSGNKKAFYPNKTWEYTRTFYVPADWRHQHVCLQFEGVYRQAMVYINGDFAGQEPTGYSVFTIDADRFLRYDEDNEIKVVARTADDSRWYTGGGIYRDVWLLTSRLNHITPFGVKITTPEISKELAAVCVRTTLCNYSEAAKAALQVQTEILDAVGTVTACDTAPITVLRGKQAVLHQRLYIASPQLWDVDAPNLYTCKTRLIAGDGSIQDESIETFGVRSLTLNVVQGLCLNGRSIKLRGACIHHDNGPLGSTSVFRAEQRRVEILKEAGFNAIRMSHHPAGPALLRACDELGMLVMDEAFDMWTETKCNFDYAQDFPTWWERGVTAMVDKDYNHPSVILYSIGNEIQETGTPNGSLWGRKLAEKIRLLDMGRYIVNSINGMVSANLLNVMRLKMQENSKSAAANQVAEGVNAEINTMMNALGKAMKQVMAMDEVTRATAESFACVDIAGYNYMDSRYAMDKELFPNRIICGSETCAPDIDQNWQLVTDNSHVIGDFCWTGWDYIGEAGIGKVNYNPNPKAMVYGDFPDLMSMTGDIDITGVRRPASFYREIVFGLRNAPYIAVQRPEHYGEKVRLSSWSWSDAVASWNWDGFEGKPIKVEVYSGADEVELLLNGMVIGRQTTGKTARYKALFDTVYQQGELVAVAYINGQESGRHTLHSASGPARLKAATDRETIRADGTDLAYIEIAVEDDAGVVLTSQNHRVMVEVDGPALLAGFGTGDPSPTEEFTAHTRTTYDGRALAVVRPVNPGTIFVTVSTGGMDEVKVKITAE